ncbi:hypothetical protein T484DRAFT_1760428, partial [Baffinella frigidus]
YRLEHGIGIAAHDQSQRTKEVLANCSQTWADKRIIPDWYVKEEYRKTGWSHMKKLVKMGLIQKGKAGRKTTYSLTAAGAPVARTLSVSVSLGDPEQLAAPLATALPVAHPTDPPPARNTRAPSPGAGVRTASGVEDGADGGRAPTGVVLRLRRAVGRTLSLADSGTKAVGRELFRLRRGRWEAEAAKKGEAAEAGRREEGSVLAPYRAAAARLDSPGIHPAVAARENQREEADEAREEADRVEEEE